MRIALAALAALGLSTYAFSAGAGGPLPPGPDSFILGNGLTVVVIEDHRAPVVTQMVWYRVGSADDPTGQSGLAHFLEHLMFKATDELADGELSRSVAESGGSANAFTTTDYTAYFERVAADQLDLVMDMEADRMVDLAPTEAAVLSERDVVLEERREMIESDPSAHFAQRCQASLYSGHPYGRPVIGWEQEIAGLTRSAAMDFYQTHYAPNNAVLVVAGDVEPNDVRELAEKHFGPIPASAAVAPRQRPREPAQRTAPRISMNDARVSEPLLRRSYLAPQRRAGDQSTAAALAVLVELLRGGGTTSAMERGLVLGEGLALQAWASYSNTGLDAQTFDLYVVPKPGVDLAEAEMALDSLIARFVGSGPDPVSLNRIKGQIRASEIYMLDDLFTRARRIGEALTSGLTLGDVAEWPNVLHAVTAEDVAAVAKALFQDERSVTCALVPSKAANLEGSVE